VPFAFLPLADFTSEVWTIVDQLYPGFNFSDYNLFAIFHAGVGRDITLPGSLGNERDLPSLYLSPKALQNIYGSSFQGFPVSGGNFRINNSMILPETESRELTSFGSTFLFEITINGLIAASVASYLGLPDLFDTETGLSAIGRFGLMDGQSIFGYNGIFPPEPSAWEKIYLGWQQPVVVEQLPGISKIITLAANAIANLSDASLTYHTVYQLLSQLPITIFTDIGKITKSTVKTWRRSEITLTNTLNALHHILLELQQFFLFPQK